jgi:uncharacterized coiled-coil protein SlyX
MSAISSIYIPRMSFNVTEQVIAMEYLNAEIGVVSRVDFTPIHKTPGFVENYDENSQFKSAFVHFYPGNYMSKNAEHFDNTIRSGSRYTFQPMSLREYWINLLNKAPIQTTMMNTSQIVENCRYLEEKVEYQERVIERQNDIIDRHDNEIAALNEQVDNIRQVVSQLVGGLFNKESQAPLLKLHQDILFEGEGNTNFMCDVSPNTEQGCNNERRIKLLEMQIKAIQEEPDQSAGSKRQLRQKKRKIQRQSERSRKMVDVDYDFDFMPAEPKDQEYQDEQEDTLSTHSSMPELEEISTGSGENRMRMSYELCGNE